MSIAELKRSFRIANVHNEELRQAMAAGFSLFAFQFVRPRAMDHGLAKHSCAGGPRRQSAVVLADVSDPCSLAAPHIADVAIGKQASEWAVRSNAEADFQADISCATGVSR